MSRVLLVSGSMGRVSYTTALLREVGQVLASEHSEVQLWDMSERPLPMFDPNFEGSPADFPDDHVRAWVHAVQSADAIVLGTPTYHNSYSGVLKNAIDWLGPVHFRRKPLGLVGNSGGIRSVQALDHLRIVTRELSAITIPSQVATSCDDFEQVGDTLVLVDEKVRQRIERFSEELVFLAQRLKAEQPIPTESGS